MENIKKFRTKKFLSIMISLCMLIPLLPLQVFADNYVATWVTIDGQTLNSEYKYLVGGVASKTPSDKSTAFFDSTRGYLELNNYDGGGIEVLQSVPTDLTISLKGDQNRIKMGINNYSGGDINITAYTSPSNPKSSILSVYKVSDGTSVRAINTKGDINISGMADVIVDADSGGDFDDISIYGLYARNINISDKANLQVNVDGKITTGIYATNAIRIETEGIIRIKSYGESSDSYALHSYSPTILKKVHELELISKGKLTNLDVKPDVTYDESKFGVEEGFTKEGYNSKTYRFSDTVYTLTVNGGSGSGKYLGEYTAFITANTPANSRFVRWKAPEDVHFEDPYSPYAEITMPLKDIEITAVFEEVKLFTEMPTDQTVAVVSEDDDAEIPVEFTLSDIAKDNTTGAILQIKNGGIWEKYDDLPKMQWEPGNRTYYLPQETEESTKTYRLVYNIKDMGNIYSNEFTIKARNAAVTGITISPKTATMGKGIMQQFTAKITGTGPFDSTLTWSLKDHMGNETSITDEGILTVGVDETAGELTVSVFSKDGTMSASAVVTVVENHKEEFTVTVINGSGGGKYLVGDDVTVTAEKVLDGKDFIKWVSTDIEIPDEAAKELSYTFTMPEKNVEVEATYKNPQPLRVINGTPIYSTPSAGDKVTITANDPPAGTVFDRWISEDMEIIPSDANNPSYKFTMPEQEVTVKATYKKDQEQGNATLKGIKFSVKPQVKPWEDGNLITDFNPNQKEYNINLPEDYGAIQFYEFNKQVAGQTATATWEGNSINLENLKDYFRTDSLIMHKGISVLLLNVTSADKSNTETYKINVKRGTATPRTLTLVNGSPNISTHLAGDEVMILANPPLDSTQEFTKWTSDDLNLPYFTSPMHIIKMPDKDTVITANYRTKNHSHTTLESINVATGKGKIELKRAFRPLFDPEIRSYDIYVPKNDNKISMSFYYNTIGYVALKMDGEDRPLTKIISGNDRYHTGTIDLTKDTTVFIATVVSRDGSTTGDYEITVYRDDDPDYYLGDSSPIIHGLSVSDTETTVGKSYYQKYALYKGEVPVTWRISEGSLPPGLTFKNGIVSGAPTKPGTYNYKIEVKNQYGEHTIEARLNVLPSPELIGIVSISGKEKVGETLTANVIGTNNTGTLTYLWERGGGTGNIGTGKTYKLTEEDIGTRIFCEVKSDAPFGTLMGYTERIPKLDGPEAPTGLISLSPKLVGSKDGKITGTTTAMEYADNIDFIGKSTCWGTEIEGLEPGIYYVRYKATPTHLVGKYAVVEVLETDIEVKSVKVSPSTATVQKGKTQDFTANVNVTGPYKTVSWSVSGNYSSQTKINSDGKLTVAADERLTNLIVTATSAYDSTKSDTAIVSVTNEEVKKYTVAVVNGEGSGQYEIGDTVNLKADVPPEGKEFDKWVSEDREIPDEAIDATEWSYVMEGRNFVFIATYKNIDGPQQEKLTGTVSISGEAKLGATLTANVSKTNNTGDLTYKWFAYDKLWGDKQSITFDEDPALLGHILVCEVTSSSHAGSIFGVVGIITRGDERDAPTGLAPINTTSELTTDGGITGTTTDMEYANNPNFDEAKTCENTETTGLSKGTYYVRYKENSAYYASDYTIIIITESGAEVKELSGTVSISGTEKFGSTLTANVSDDSNNSGTLMYSWQREGTEIGTQKIYSLKEDDIEKTLTCLVTSSVESGSISGSSGIIAKADGPGAPIGLNTVKTSWVGEADGKITGTTNLMEYADNTDFTEAGDCQEIETTGLAAGTYYVRVKATNTHNAGDFKTVIVDGAEIDKELIGTVSISGIEKFGETLTATVSGTNNTGVLTYSWRWEADTDEIGSGSTYILKESDIGKKLTCLVTSSVQIVGGITGLSGTIANADGPEAPTGLSTVKTTSLGGTDGKIIGTTKFMEYAIASDFTDAIDCPDDVEITGLSAGIYFVRVKATSTHNAGKSLLIIVEDGVEGGLTGTVVISGTEKYGSTLAATVNGSNNTGTLTYKWYRDIIEIATGENYILGEEDIGKELLCEVASSIESGNIYKVSGTIGKADGPALTGVTADDELNSLSGMTKAMEFSADDGSTWIPYNETTPNLPDLTENIVLQVRFKETSTHLAGTIETFDFTGIPAIKYTATVTNGSGSGKYKENEIVSIQANPAPLGEEFDKWVVRLGSATLDNEKSSSTTFNMPATDVTVEATYVSIPITITGVTVSPPSANVQKGTTQTFSATVTGTGAYDSTVNWDVTGGISGTTINNNGELTIAEDETASTLTVLATSTSDNSKSGTATVTVTDEPLIKFNVTVIAGSGSGEYEESDTVSIQANPAPVGKEFDRWVVKSGSVILANSKSQTTSFDMPATNVSVEATYKSSGGGGSSSGGGSASATTTYTIKINAGKGGSFDTSKSVTVKEGRSVKFNIIPDDGYEIEDIKVDGKSVGAVSSYEFTKVRENHSISATFKKVEEIEPEIEQDPEVEFNFYDVSESEWHYDSVMKAFNKGWFTGTSDTMFSPNTPMSRGMIVTVLWRIEGQPAAMLNSFNDVATDMYYNSPVAWAAEKGIVNGYGNGVFGPNDSITREQMVSILYRYAQYKGYDTTQGGMAIREFADYENISEYALPTLAWGVNTGLIQGANNKIMPKDSATRAQVAAMLMRFSETIVK